MRVLVAAVVLTASLLAAAPAGATLHNVSGALSGSDPTIMGRPSRNGVASDCSGPKAYPGTLNTSTAYAFDAYAFTNTSAASACVVVDLNADACSANLFAFAYSGVFDSGNLATDYAGDAGVSTNPGQRSPFGFVVPPGGSFTVVVQSTVASPPCSGTYSATISDGPQATIIRKGDGANPSDIQLAVDQFRSDLGDLNPNTTANPSSGRREINWDGVPDNFAAPNNLPGDFFNANSPRGVLLSTPGSALQVSANAFNPTSTPVRFGNLNPNYPTTFQAFSPERLFSPTNSAFTDVAFVVPGTGTPAKTRAFGAVFTNKAAGVSAIRLRNAAGEDIGWYSASTAPGSMSFVGAVLPGNDIASVRVVSDGQAPPPGNGATAMDDFIYAEPQGPPVTSPAPGQGGGSGGTGSTGTGAAANPPLAPAPLDLAKVVLGAMTVKSGKVDVQLRNDNEVPVAGTLTLTSGGGAAKLAGAARRKKRKQAKPVTVASGPFSVAVGATTTAVLPLSRAGKALLAKKRRLRVTATLAVTGEPARAVNATVVGAKPKPKRKRR